VIHSIEVFRKILCFDILDPDVTSPGRLLEDILENLRCGRNLFYWNLVEISRGATFNKNVALLFKLPKPPRIISFIQDLHKVGSLTKLGDSFHNGLLLEDHVESPLHQR